MARKLATFLCGDIDYALLYTAMGIRSSIRRSAPEGFWYLLLLRSALKVCLQQEEPSQPNAMINFCETTSSGVAQTFFHLFSGWRYFVSSLSSGRQPGVPARLFLIHSSAKEVTETFIQSCLAVVVTLVSVESVSVLLPFRHLHL